jgi:hypothetical protein
MVVSAAFRLSWGGSRRCCRRLHMVAFWLSTRAVSRQTKAAEICDRPCSVNGNGADYRKAASEQPASGAMRAMLFTSW